MKQPEILSCLIIGGLPVSITNFREPLIRAILKKGVEVHVAVNGFDPYVEARMRDLRVSYHAIHITRAGTNPFVDIMTLLDLIRLIRTIKPSLVLSYTIKPVIYGGLAARFCRIPAIFSLITGLGYAFADRKSWRQLLVGYLAKFLYRCSLCKCRRVFFQNPDDRDIFVEMGLARQEQAVVVSGSGVDLDSFPFKAINLEKATARGLVFLLIARLLRDKGICEYAEAARMLKERYPQTKFLLVGDFDPNPMGLKPEDISAWEKDGVLDFKGYQKDVRPFFQMCDVYVLPSFYREGTPRTVLEAMSMGRAVITTDAPGCRETINFSDSRSKEKGIDDVEGLKFGQNGILVPARNAGALAKAMEFFINQPERVEVMGRESRVYAEQRYDVHKVNAVILKEMGFE